MREEYLGSFLRKLRAELNCTLKDVADKIGKSPMFISNLEQERKIPVNGEGLKKVAEFYGVDYEDLKQKAILTLAAKHENKSSKDVSKIKLSLARMIISSELDDKKLLEIEKLLKK